MNVLKVLWTSKKHCLHLLHLSIFHPLLSPPSLWSGLCPHQATDPALTGTRESVKVEGPMPRCSQNVSGECTRSGECTGICCPNSLLPETFTNSPPRSPEELGGSHGRKRLVGYNPWSCKVTDTTEHTSPLSSADTISHQQACFTHSY